MLMNFVRFPPQVKADHIWDPSLRKSGADNIFIKSFDKAHYDTSLFYQQNLAVNLIVFSAPGFVSIALIYGKSSS